MSFFTNASKTVISAQNVMMNAYAAAPASDSVREGLDILRQNTTPAALYGSSTFGKDPGCLPGTRANVQDYIIKWLNDPDGETAMWMYGPAGAGKTAIAQTVAKICGERGQLSSSFFFFRSDVARNSVKHLVPTLAYGMLRHMPHARDVVCIPIADDPLMLSAPLMDQIRTIILPALLEPFPSLHNTQRDAMLLLIDGLDECMDSGIQQSIIRSFISLLATTTTVIRLKILIVSRPESHIVSAFSAGDIASHVHHLCLDQWGSITDIEIYLRAELEAIRQTHPLKSYLDAQWPSEASLSRLLHKSFESFAYASSAIRYISSHDRHPETSLDNLLVLNPDSAYEAHAELDTLYRHILDNLDKKTRITVRKILCLYVYLSVGDIEYIGYLLGEATFVVALVITKMSSVVRLQKSTSTISYYHTSFGDFLVDKGRSGALYLYSPDIASAVSKSLSRSWMHPTTKMDFKCLELIASSFSGNMGAEEMHAHVLRDLLAIPLPQKFVVPLSRPYILAMYPFFVFFDEINTAAYSQHYPDTLRSLFCDALQHLVAWLGSQGSSPCALDNILDAIFIPNWTWDAPLGHSPHLWGITINIGIFNRDPWHTICLLLSREERWEICAEIVKRYLTMPPEAYSEERLSRILIQALTSVPAKAEICSMLEKIVLQTMTDSLRELIPQDLIFLYLCRDMRHLTELRSLRFTISSAAKAMDQYIRKTHSESHLPYISDELERLYSTHAFPGVEGLMDCSRDLWEL